MILSLAGPIICLFVVETTFQGSIRCYKIKHNNQAFASPEERNAPSGSSPIPGSDWMSSPEWTTPAGKDLSRLDQLLPSPLPSSGNALVASKLCPLSGPRQPRRRVNLARPTSPLFAVPGARILARGDRLEEA
ncbi:hypothetical protein MRS44_008355 [Fusarium solani]|uniref:uncharacterized protein n=1 Tax=Fusarium solani TaxID=169388 RepID=UPI0032C428FB|nr:hypothetical protein MRS44_008355 [Fusarium solani]